MSPRSGIRIFAKLEGQNPSGSIKDRIVLSIVEAAESRGELSTGDTVIEASSGNTAIALAMVGKQKGYEMRVVIPRGVAPSVTDVLRLYDVDVIWCEPQAGMKGAIDLARQMAEDNGYYYLGQFTDEMNIETHYRTTGLEIVQALPEVDLFVAGIGTGGTITGVGRRLRESVPNVRVVGVEPRLGEKLQGLRSLSEGFAPHLLDISQLDGRILVDSSSAIGAAREVIQKEGIFAGISSGATLYAALRMSKDIDRGNIVVMFSDGGWKYLPARPWDAAEEGSEDLDETLWW